MEIKLPISAKTQVAQAADQSIVVQWTGDRATAERVYAAFDETLDADETATALFERADGRWTASAHCCELPDMAELQRCVAATIGAEAATGLSIETVTAADWVSESLAGLAPVVAGRFVIHGRHDRAAVPPNRIGLEIEAALAFGTGHHGTTRGCLMALDRLLKAGRPRHVLDVGAGTGVLAMAAARALRRRVVASDIDAVAVTTATANAHNNRAAAWMRIVRAAGVNHPAIRRTNGYDLMFANILLGPLQRLAGPLARLAAPGGRVILSGLLPAHANAAYAAYRVHGLMLDRRLTVDGWITLVLRDARKASPRRARGTSGR